MDEIFKIKIDTPKSIDDAVLAFFNLSKNRSSVINNVTVYPGKRRSIEDCYEFCKQYFNITLDDVAKSVLTLCANGGFVGYYCYEVKRFVFCFSVYKLNLSYKGISKSNYGWFRPSEHEQILDRYLTWFSNVMNECYIIGYE